MAPAASCRWPRPMKRNVSRDKRTDVVLGGERAAVRIAGFDLGNSPLEYTPGAVGDKLVVLTTTNGTQAFAKVQRASVAPAAPGAVSARSRPRRRSRLRLTGRVRGVFANVARCGSRVSRCSNPAWMRCAHRLQRHRRSLFPGGRVLCGRVAGAHGAVDGHTFAAMGPHRGPVVALRGGYMGATIVSGRGAERAVSTVAVCSSSA